MWCSIWWYVRGSLVDSGSILVELVVVAVEEVF